MRIVVCPIAEACKSTLKKFCHHRLPHPEETDCYRGSCTLDVAQLKGDKCQPVKETP